MNLNLSQFIPKQEIDLSTYEKKVFSVNGEDGITMQIFNIIGIKDFSCLEIKEQIKNNCNSRILWQQNFITDKVKKWEFCLLNKEYHNPIKNCFFYYENENSILNFFKFMKLPVSLDFFSLNMDKNDFLSMERILTIYKPRLILVKYDSSFTDTEDKIDLENNNVSLLSWYKLLSRFDYSLVYCDKSKTSAFFVYNPVIPVNLIFKNENNLKIFCSNSLKEIFNSKYTSFDELYKNKKITLLPENSKFDFNDICFNVKNSDFTVLSFFDETFMSVGNILTKNHKEYCEKHSYNYICKKKSVLDVLHWSKIKFIQEILPTTKYLLWIDADAFFFNINKKLENILKEKPLKIIPEIGITNKYNIKIPKSNSPFFWCSIDKNGPCTGIFLLRNCPESIDFLSFLFSFYKEYLTNPYEQHTLSDIISNNKYDLSKFCFLKQNILHGSWMKYEENPFIIHLASTKNNDRIGLFNNLNPLNYNANKIQEYIKTHNLSEFYNKYK